MGEVYSIEILIGASSGFFAFVEKIVKLVVDTPRKKGSWQDN